MSRRLCIELQKLSSEAFNWITAQPAVKEESLTDWLLYEFSKRCKNVAYKAFTRHEEAKVTGADWDWLFVFQDGAFYLRVQAKKLSAGSDNYPGLARTNQYGQQITKLISSAKAVSALPVYAFYSDGISHNACSRVAFGGKIGAYLCGAQTVDCKFVKTRTFVADTTVLSVSYPLPCIACYGRFMGNSAISLALRFAELFPDKDMTESKHFTLGYLQHSPDWADAVLKNRMQFPEWWEQEFSRSFTETDALVIVDNRASHNLIGPNLEDKRT